MLIMSDWYIQHCLHNNAKGIACENHAAGDQIVAVNDRGATYDRTTGTFKCTDAPPPSREKSPMNGTTAKAFTDVEGESIEGCVVFARCSRSMRLIATTNTKECVSCGRAVLEASLEWSWLKHKGCGVCGTSVGYSGR